MHNNSPKIIFIHEILPANLSFFLIIRMLTKFSPQEKSRSKNSSMDLLRGFMLASIAKFFFLPIIIWRDNISDLSSSFHITVHLGIVISYFLISLIYIHASVSGCSKKSSTANILLSFMLNKYLWFYFSGNMYM